MLLPLLILEFFVLFAVWTIFIFHKLAIIVLVNLVIGTMIALRIYHDLKIKRYVSVYIGASVLTLGLIITGMTSYTLTISKFLSRFMLLEAVQILCALFLVSQVLIWIKKFHN